MSTSRGGTIKRIGEKKYKISWNQGRRRPNIRKVIHGTREMAERALDTLRSRFYSGQFGWPHERDSVQVQTLTQLVVDDYIANGYKSLRQALGFQKFFGQLADKLHLSTALMIDATKLSDWSKEWRAGGLSAGRVNRRMSFLLRAFKLGKERGLVPDIPVFHKLEEAKPRSGKFEWSDFLKIRSLLPPHARIPVTIEYWLGTREGETMSLEWAQVSFDHKNRLITIRLKPIDTKDGEERAAVMGGDLFETLLAWHKESRRNYPACAFVCHLHGKGIKGIKTSWRTACVAAGLGRFSKKGKYVGNRGYVGPLVHDFRRTAVSTMEDAGVPRKIGMLISGHATDAIYRRYHIVKKQDLIEAGRKVLEHHQQKHGLEAVSGEHLVNTSPTATKRKLIASR